MMVMTMIVAEIGVNWNGDLKLAKEMMIQAKKCFCDAVKFQAYNKELVKDHPKKELLLKSAISCDNIETINEIAASVGIEWFCTPMYPEAVQMLDPYVKRFKIRELDGRPLLKNKMTQLLECVFETKKEIFVSSVKSPKDSNFYKHSQLKWLYCVPKYPCQLNDLNFEYIHDYYGYSNHCPEIIAPLTAAILGCSLIEIHVTLDKSKNFLDNDVSFNFEELDMIVKYVRKIEKIKR